MNTDVGMISVESKNKIELVVHNFPNNSIVDYSILLFLKCVLHGQFNFLSANNSIMLHKQEKLDLQCTTSKTFEIINVLNNLISMNFY